jgi:DNA (cytosine-5)-methyltransferase 1
MNIALKERPSFQKKHSIKSKNTNAYIEEINTVLRPQNSGISCVSMFCGGGGLDLGFASAGFDVRFSSDIDATFCRTVSRNFLNHISEPYDITDLSGKYIRNVSGSEVDFIIGGPPCQSFSILGKRDSTNDPRGKLVFEYARIISELKPKGFLFENVPGLLTLNRGKDWEEIKYYFHKETGYTLHARKLNSVEYGVPQYRERVFLIGIRHDLSFKWPAPEYTKSADASDFHLKPARASRLALEYLLGIPNHEKRVHGERVKTRYSNIPQGGRDKVDHTDRINIERPSGTVLVGSAGGGGRPFIHPLEHRHITVREAARLQSFPDWWFFEGGSTSQYRQVGNAVPPLLARKVALAIKAHIFQE